MSNKLLIAILISPDGVEELWVLCREALGAAAIAVAHFLDLLWALEGRPGKGPLMALQLAEFLYYTPEEKVAAARLPLDSRQRKSMLARKLAEIRATQHIERKQNVRRL